MCRVVVLRVLLLRWSNELYITDIGPKAEAKYKHCRGKNRKASGILGQAPRAGGALLRLRPLQVARPLVHLAAKRHLAAQLPNWC